VNFAAAEKIIVVATLLHKVTMQAVALKQYCEFAEKGREVMVVVPATTMARLAT
jgi:hypothetical protein